jgi:hypothetical protein
MEPNSGEKEDVVERQEIPNEEVVIHSLRACRKETAVSQEATEAEKTEPDRAMMQSVADHQVAPKEHAAVETGKLLKKRRRGRKPAAERRGEPKELTRRDCGSGRSWLPPAGRCPAVQQWHGGKGTSLDKLRPRKIVDRARTKDDPLCRRGVVRKGCTRAKDERVTQRVERLRENLRMHHEG